MRNFFDPLLLVELPIATPKIRQISITDFETILAEVKAEKSLTFAGLQDFWRHTQKDFDVEL